MIHDVLGTRMKEQYETRTRTLLPRRTYTIIRLDGKAFHTWTRGFARPYDKVFIHRFDAAVAWILPEIQGAQFAYTQSDEASILLTDFATIDTAAWFDGQVQKIVSVTASLMAGAFNRLYPFHKIATFDARTFTIPDRTEVENYFIWRQQDAERNSLSLLCQAHFSAKELHGKDRNAQHEMLHSVGVNWAKEPDRFKRGGIIHKLDGAWKIYAAPQFNTREKRVLTETGLIPAME